MKAGSSERTSPFRGRGHRPTRLLLVVDSLQVGGAERQVVGLAVTLGRRGYEVVVACSVAGELASLLEEAGVPVRPLMGRLVKRRVSPRYALRLGRLMRGERFDLVHAHIYASAAAAALAALGTGLPLVITEHTEGTWQGWRARWVSRWVYRRVERLIAVSASIRRRLLERDGVHPDLITIVPNAVTSPPEPRPDSLPPGLRESSLVGTVARLQPEKGIESFLNAAARIAPLFPMARFVIVGDGPLREELAALAEDLGLGDRLHFLGFRPDASAVMGSLDVLVVPSLTEGSPLVTLEAMSAGIPIIASAVGGIPDQVLHGRDGLLVPPGDPGAIAEALISLLRDSARARRLGEAGRRRAASLYSHETMVQQIEAVYREVLGLPAASEVEELGSVR